MSNDKAYHESVVWYNKEMQQAALEIHQEARHPRIRRWLSRTSEQHRVHAQRHRDILADMASPVEQDEAYCEEVIWYNKAMERAALDIAHRSKDSRVRDWCKGIARQHREKQEKYEGLLEDLREEKNVENEKPEVKPPDDDPTPEPGPDPEKAAEPTEAPVTVPGETSPIPQKLDAIFKKAGV